MPWVAGTKHTPFLSEVVDQVRDELRSREVDLKPATKPAGLKLEELGTELNLGLAKVSAKMTAGTATDPPPALIGGLTRFLREASVAVRDRGGAGLALIIDELHAPLESTDDRKYVPVSAAQLDASTLLNAAQVMDADRTRYPFALLAAGLPETKPFLMRAATFGERTREISISDLDPVNSAKLLTQPAANLGVSWDTEALNQVVAEANGYPYALQVAGEATWDAAKPQAGTILTADHVRDGSPQATADMHSMYRGRWELATPAERLYLTAMAVADSSPVRRAELAALLGVDRDSLNPIRDSLISKGVIESAGHGLVRFTIPGFATFITERDDLSLPGAPSRLRPAIRPPDLATGQAPESSSPPAPHRTGEARGRAGSSDASDGGR